ncbi:MAG: hypothetical protein A2583_02285 [Bdellovibrionales bacterium RIFOXYD1_FULL_53_11]|nr:MAG: hypothetical protein A2583_02285 [Bdellovibrionales bacterium RIFOXYD1_FULL_53_11]
MKSGTGKRNFHIPLSDETYIALRHASEKTKKPATQIARDALDYWLKEQENNAIKDEITRYAKSFAKTEFDLDAGLEEAGVDYLLNAEKKRR